MNESHFVAQVLRAMHALASESSRSAQALLGWIEESRAHFWPETLARRRKGKKGRTPKPFAWNELPRLSESLAVGGERCALMGACDAVSDILGLAAFDAALLRTVVAFRRLHRLATLRSRLAQSEDLPLLFGIMAGEQPSLAAQAVRQSQTVSLGLVETEVTRSGVIDLDLSWSFDRLLNRGLCDDDALIEALVGIRQQPHLSGEDFLDHAEAFDFLTRLFSGARSGAAPGINLLLHGPPGTGKTEFARALAEAAGLRLFAVGEADEDGEEPNRFFRLHALKRAQRLLARRTDSMLLFDEMEDLFVPPANGNAQQAGSKIFVNRLLETNPVPTIWTSNAIAAVDPAHLRRMSFILAMGHGSTRSRQRIVEKIVTEEAAATSAADLAVLARDYAATPSIARVAARSASIAGSGEKDADLAARSLLVGLRDGHPLPLARASGSLHLELFESDPPISALIARLSAEGSPRDFSILLAGPPGTGKTALADHIAAELNRPLLVKRTSDLLSKWVGQTEGNIAAAFAEARTEGAVLLFDEVDSLLLDRRDARHSWEITQVNELLTWLDAHDLPVIAATNFVGRLDPAAMRRFHFKIHLLDLSVDRAIRAFRHFFGMEPPVDLCELRGLTPGDFAVVARQLRFGGDKDAGHIVQLLARELSAKPCAMAKIGF